MGIDTPTIAKSAPVMPVATKPRETEQSGNEAAHLDTVKASVANQIKSLQETAEKEVSSEVLQEAVKQGNAYFQEEHRDMQIHIDDDTKKVVVKIINRANGELIRQMPTKDALDFVRKMQQQASSNGLLIKQNV